MRDIFAWNDGYGFESVSVFESGYSLKDLMSKDSLCLKDKWVKTKNWKKEIRFETEIEAYPFQIRFFNYSGEGRLCVYEFAEKEEMTKYYWKLKQVSPEIKFHCYENGKEIDDPKAEVKGKVIMALKSVNMGFITIDEKTISVMTRECGFIIENKKKLPNVKVDLSGSSGCLMLNDGIYSFKDSEGVKEVNEDIEWWIDQLGSLFQRFDFVETEIFEQELD